MDKKPETDMAMGSTRFGIPSGHNRHDATPFFISVMRASLDRQDQTFERALSMARLWPVAVLCNLHDQLAFGNSHKAAHDRGCVETH